LATPQLHEVDPQKYVGYRSGAADREMAAYLCRQWAGVSLAKLSAVFGLEHPDSSSNLVRRAKRRAEASLEYHKIIILLETKLGLKTENQVCPRRSPLAYQSDPPPIPV